MNINRNFANKKDMVIIIVIIIIALVLWLMRSKEAGDAKAVIMVDGAVVKEMPLDTPATFSVPERSGIVFEINNNKVRFKYSDCPDQICVHSGFLGETGQIAVCLPNKTVLKVVGDDLRNDVDIIIGMVDYEYHQ